MQRYRLLWIFLGQKKPTRKKPLNRTKHHFTSGQITNPGKKPTCLPTQIGTTMIIKDMRSQEASIITSNPTIRNPKQESFLQGCTPVGPSRMSRAWCTAPSPPSASWTSGRGILCCTGCAAPDNHQQHKLMLCNMHVRSQAIKTVLRQLFSFVNPGHIYRQNFMKLSMVACINIIKKETWFRPF